MKRIRRMVLERWVSEGVSYAKLLKAAVITADEAERFESGDEGAGIAMLVLRLSGSEDEAE